MSIIYLTNTICLNTDNKEVIHIVLFSFYLNRVGRNVAAGMTGGLAYILDEDDTLIPKV